MATDLIDDLAGMSDADLAKKLGFEDKVKQFKADIAKAAPLSGEPRKKVLAALTRAFTPDTWVVSDIGHTIERATKPEKMCPAKLVSDCGCGDYD